MSPIYTFTPKYIIENWLEDFDLAYKESDMQELCNDLNAAFVDHVQEELHKLFH